jgi:hypothetical protein
MKCHERFIEKVWFFLLSNGLSNMIQKIGLLSLFLAVNFAVGGASHMLAIIVSNEIVPTGGTAYVKVFAAKPTAISSGCIHLAFKGGPYPTQQPAITGGPTVFSSSLDASAVGGLTEGAGGQSPFGLGFCFYSPSAGVGRVPGLPIAEFSISATESFSVSVETAKPLARMVLTVSNRLPVA